MQNQPRNRKEDRMLALNCCKTMEAELTAWKANVYDIVRRMEGLGTADRERVLPNIEDLHILIAEMDDRIDQIRVNCRPETCIEDIQTDREKFEKSLSQLRVTADEAMRGLGAGNFGG
jgi:hypothetical protein